MTWDLHDFRLVTASAYPGMMAPLTQHPSCVCVMSGDAGIQVPGGPGSLSLETLDGVRRRWRFGDVARLADFVPKLLAETPPDNRPLLLIPPRSSHAWEAAAAAWPGVVKVVGRPTVEVGQIAENKIFVRQELQQIGVPVPTAVDATPGMLDFGILADKLGLPFVIQKPNGAGGQGTHLIRSAANLEAALAEQPFVEQWLASEYAGDVTINVAGVVHADGVHLLPVSLQASAIRAVGSEFGGYCGSDFGISEHLPPSVVDAAYTHTRAIGEWLRRRGHLGLFGADIAVSGEKIAFLEVNPRIQGSSWLLSKLQRRRGELPCLEEHVQALLGGPLARSGPAHMGAGSHLIVRWTGPAGVVRSAVSTGDYPSGITVTGTPAPGVTVTPGAILARLESAHSLTTPDGHTMLPDAQAALSLLHAEVKVL